MNQNIREFIEAAKDKGAADETIGRILREAGWSEKQVNGAILELYEEKTGMKAPMPGGMARGESAKDAFLHLLAFGTLGTWVGAIASLVFTLLDKYLPDYIVGGGFYSNTSYSISTQLASIIVALPVYLYTMSIIMRDIEKSPEKADSGVRKWLTYIALLITAGVLIGDVITFLAYLLRGELTERFVLKVVTVVILAGGIFWYYLTTLKQEKQTVASSK
jgi:Domain of unknown function (DUF5671)